MKTRIYAVPLLLGAIAIAVLFWRWSGQPKQPTTTLPTPEITSSSSIPRKNAEPSPSLQPLLSDAQAMRPPSTSAMTAEQVRQLEERGRREASLAVVADIYEAFLRQAGLDQEATDAFLNYTCDERLAALAGALAARAQGIRWMDNPETEERVMRGATSRDAEIRQLLGAERYRQFEDYRRTSNIRTTINQISDRLDDAKALSNDQILQLAAAFSALQEPRKTARAPADAVLQLIGMPLTNPMIEAARSVLTDPQFAALVAVRESQLQAISQPDKKTVGSPGAINPGTGTH